MSGSYNSYHDRHCEGPYCNCDERRYGHHSSGDQIKPNSTKSLYWKCPDCGYTWKQKPTNRINNNTCPVCDVKYKALDEYNGIVI